MTNNARIQPAIRVFVLLTACLSMTGPGGARTQTNREKQVPTSTVRFIPVGVYGNELGASVNVELFQSQSEGDNLAARFHGDVASGIPYGIYKARVYVRGFWSAERAVQVFQPNVIAVVALEIGMDKTEGGLRTSNVSGLVRGTDPSAGLVRIRLSGVYSTTIIDTEVNNKGEFSLRDVPEGDYALVVTQANKVLGVKAIKLLPHASSISIDVGETKGALPNEVGRPNP